MTKFQLLEEQLRNKPKITATIGPNPFNSQTRAAPSTVSTEQSTIPAKRVKQENLGLEIGVQVRYLNIHSNRVEIGTFMGLQGEKLKLSIGKGRTQKFILITSDHIIRA